MEEIIKPILPADMLDAKTKYYINPTGRFVIGGPVGDCGVTGRKIIVDTYGGKGSHGGGAFSGKDPSKVDRSSSYMGRYVAKNIIAAGIATEIEVQIAYAIGISNPVSINVNSFGTGKVSDDTIRELILEVFDLRPKAISPAARPSQTHLHADRLLWPLWPGRGGIYLGAYRQGQHSPGSRKDSQLAVTAARA